MAEEAGRQPRPCDRAAAEATTHAAAAPVKQTPQPAPPFEQIAHIMLCATDWEGEAETSLPGSALLTNAEFCLAWV